MDAVRIDPMLAHSASIPYDAPRTRVILLVDDDSILLYVLTEILMERGYSVFPCNSGEMALQTFKNQPQVDLLITDFKMPGINGVQLATALLRRQAGLPVILMSASMKRTVISAEEKQTRWQFFEKPFDLALFLKAVSALLGEDRLLQRSLTNGWAVR